MNPLPIRCLVPGCTRIYHGRGLDYTAAEQDQQARAAGWRLGTRADGTADAICPADARPDPKLVALCAELAKPSTVEDT